MPFDPYYGNTTDEELLALGRASGVIPEKESGAYYDMESPAPEEEAPTRQDFHTWVPEQLGYTPAYDTPPTTPEAAPQKTSTGLSASDRGFQIEKYNQIQRTSPGLEGQYQQADRRAAQGAQRMAAPAQQAATGSVDAEKTKAQATVASIKAQGEEALVLQRMQDDFAAHEATENARAQAMANQSKADYMAALADFRASRVDPAQLWGKMTSGERFGTLVSAFVHDFLGAKGINTSAISTLNKAIDRNIDAQVQAIRTKGEVAEGFKSLYWMQRNQSASEAEARTRVRGFLLEGAKQAVIAHMAPYEAALASAQGKQAIAKIDEELSKTLIDIYRHADQNAISLRDQALRKWQTQVNAALESRAIKVQERKEEREAGAGGVDLTSLVPDVTFSGGGKARYILTNPKDEVATREVRNRLGGLRSFDNNMKRLREISREVGSMPTTAARAQLLTQRQREILQIRDKLAFDAVKASSGAQYTDKELAQWQAQFPVDTWFTREDVDQQLAMAHAMVHEDVGARISPWVMELDEGDPRKGLQIAPDPFSLPGQSEYTEAINTFEPPKETPEEKQRKQAQESLGGPAGREPLEEPSSEAIRVWHQAAERFPKQFKRTGFAEDPTEGPKEVVVPIKSFAKGLIDLRRLARKGDKAAMDQIVKIAQPYWNDPVNADAESALAVQILYTMGDDPEPVSGQ